MMIIVGSISWIFGLAFIFNSIELSSQSDSPKLPPESYRDLGTPYPELSTKSGTPLYILKQLEIPNLPVRKVRCPTRAQRTEHSSFMMKDSNGFYQECTPDKILLAIGPMIYGNILEDRIRAIAGIRCSEILYDERKKRQFPVSIEFLKENFNVHGLVPEHILDLEKIDPFGVYEEHAVAILPVSPPPPSPVSESDRESASSLQSPRRLPKKFISKIFRCSSGGFPKPPSSGSSSSG